ncbi:MAG: secretin N-terminal domain-containing protein, partial [Phycisphaerales bacterium]|nr:secretin N-terminal domain-containing protein [Phycisphaerales bacterium]
VASGVLDREDRVSAQPDERTNTLIVATSSRSFAMLDEILASLDSPLSVDFQEIHLLQLKHATAARMAAVVQRMMDARLDRLRSVEPETAELQRVTVMTDERTNSLIIAAGQDAFEVAQQLVAELDGSELVQRGLIEVIPADRTNASRVAQTIKSVMQRRYADVPSNVRAAQIPLVLVDTRSNSLLVSAGPDDLDDIRSLVEKLAAAPTDPAIGLHLLPVNGTAQAERLAPRLQQLMRERQRSLGEASTPTDRVSIQPDGGTNSLIVAASRENLEVIKGLLGVLQQAEEARGTGRELEVISLQVTSAPAMVEMLDDLYVKEANRLRGNGSIRVTADERLNAVLVSASPHDVAEIKKLVGRLDGTSPSSVVEIQHVPLTSANALETVRLIEDVLSGRSLGGRRRNDRATVLRYVRQAEGAEDGSEMEVSTALRESINLTPDIRTNTIIVKAPSDSMGLLIDMIRDLDESSVGSKNVRIFKLENADAAAMASLLKDLFRLDEGEDLLVLKPRESVGVTELGGDGLMEEQVNISGAELTAVPDPRQQLAITVDSRTNSLIVSGTPAYLDLVQSVIDELDALDANERETFLYQLRNATASDVAEVLGDFVETEQQKLIETIGVQQLGSAARLLEREITIRGDDKSNSVLVSASPRYMDRIKGVIEELDIDPPQVLIQVLLAEVTLDGGVDWGVDMTKTGGSFSFDMSLAAFPSGIAGGLPSMTLGISDFSIVLKALENQGRLHILSNPSIMAANNEPANINVGEIIYVPVGAQTFDTGLTSVPLEEKEIGVILSVTPSINPDGYVRMVVQPTLSKVSTETDKPAVGVETPRIIQRTADTTVTVRDGQTIVIGGLINESYEYHEDKVPLLGDIPLLGLLFKSEFEELIRTELVIVLTPHVITSPAAFDRITELTDRQVDRLSLPPELLEQIQQGEVEGMGLFNRDGYKLQLRDLEEEIAPEAAEESEAP